MSNSNLLSRLSDVLGSLAPPILPVWIEGIEVTQSIQYYQADRHLTDPSDRGPDNSVRLIANKAAWVRVYVRSWSGDEPGIVGALEIQRRRRLSSQYTPSTMSWKALWPGVVTAHSTPDYATERADIQETLNFVIPSDEFWGDLRLTVRIWGEDGTKYLPQTLDVDATLRQTLRVRGIPVHYKGPSTAGPSPTPFDLPAPKLADLAATSAYAMRAMPVQATGEFTMTGERMWDHPLDDSRSCSGCCSPNWDALLAALADDRKNDGNRSDVVYYGLLPTGIPLNVPGCGTAGLGAAMVGDEFALMHEIGHGYGFAHTPCGDAGATDPDYPTYEPYDPASIGEYGLDIADGTVMPPAKTHDYMSYCGPKWMSLYQHKRLILHPRLGAEWVRGDISWLRLRSKDFPHFPEGVDRDPREGGLNALKPIIAITGIVREPGRVEVLSVARVSVTGQPPGRTTALTARLVDADAQTLSRAVVRRLSPQGEGCSCRCDGHGDDAPYVFEVYVPDVDLGAALVIEEGEHTVWERHAPETGPEARGVEAEATEEGLTLRWEGGDRDTDTWVQWSSDAGTTWNGLATGLRGGHARLGLAGVPDGEVLIRVLVHDGFSTAASEPVAVSVPRRPPEVAILHPADGAILLAEGTFQLSAWVADPAGRPVDAPQCRWLLDGQEVGEGLEVWTDSPGPGRHSLTLLAGVGDHEVERSVSFRCLPDDEFPGS